MTILRIYDPVQVAKLTNSQSWHSFGRFGVAVGLFCSLEAGPSHGFPPAGPDLLIFRGEANKCNTYPYIYAYICIASYLSQVIEMAVFFLVFFYLRNI